MKPTLAALLAVVGLGFGCGGDEPTAPTPRTFTYETLTQSTIRAHTASCVGFRQESAGEASAAANLSTGPSTPIEMGAGTCSGTRSVVARGDLGAVSATLAVGDSYVRFENTTDRDATYNLTLRHLKLY